MLTYKLSSYHTIEMFNGVEHCKSPKNNKSNYQNTKYFPRYDIVHLRLIFVLPIHESVKSACQNWKNIV